MLDMYELVCQMYTMVLKYGCMYIQILIIAQQVLVRWYGRVHLAWLLTTLKVVSI